MWVGRRSIWVMVAVALLGIALGPCGLAGRFLSNLGLLALNRAWVRHPGIRSDDHDVTGMMAAEQWLQAASEIDASNPGTWRGLGFVLFFQGQRDEAVAVWQASGGIGGEFLHRGEMQYRLGQYDEALAWYDLAARVEPDLESTHLYFRYRTLKARGDIEEATSQLEQAVTLDRGWRDLAARFQAWHDWGIWLYEQQRTNEAEHVFLEAIASYPAQAGLESLLSETYRFLGLSQWAQDNLSAALDSLSKAVQLDERNVWAHIHYGKVLFLQDAQRVAEVEKEFDTAFELSPDNVTVWENIIDFWRWRQEVERAEILCHKVQKKNFASDLIALCPVP